MMKQQIIQADARYLPLEDASVQMICTSPPYWSLRDYGLQPSAWSDGWFGCLGLEPSPELFIEHMVIVFREARRVLRDDGVLFLNIGDSYQNAKGQAGGVDPKQPARRHLRGARPNDVSIIGLKPKDRVGIPHMLAFALRADGWYFRDEIVWHKPNPMPESVSDRTTKAHEFIFVFTKSPRYFYDADAIREPVTSAGGASFGKQNHDVAGTMAQSRALADPAERNHPLGRNKRSVWTIATQSCPEAHFATFPLRLPLTCIKAGTSEKGCCPKCGAPWKREVTKRHENPGNRSTNGPRSEERKHLEYGSAGFAQRLELRVETTGWLPSCECVATGESSGPDVAFDPIPCAVLDNFHGAGTTAIAAEMLGRSYVGIELKPEYIAISRERIEKHRAKRALLKPKRRAPMPVQVETLFGGVA